LFDPSYNSSKTYWRELVPALSDTSDTSSSIVETSDPRTDSLTDDQMQPIYFSNLIPRTPRFEEDDAPSSPQIPSFHFNTPHITTSQIPDTPNISSYRVPRTPRVPFRAPYQFPETPFTSVQDFNDDIDN